MKTLKTGPVLAAAVAVGLLAGSCAKSGGVVTPPPPVDFGK
ncbi:MAG: hypothetical protein O3A92_15870 [Verrucomicrobia bacterium]|nr:hypothetical protein [Verrucomicrobiota bacterium]